MAGGRPGSVQCVPAQQHHCRSDAVRDGGTQRVSLPAGCQSLRAGHDRPAEHIVPRQHLCSGRRGRSCDCPAPGLLPSPTGSTQPGRVAAPVIRATSATRGWRQPQQLIQPASPLSQTRTGETHLRCHNCCEVVCANDYSPWVALPLVEPKSASGCVGALPALPLGRDALPVAPWHGGPGAFVAHSACLIVIPLSRKKHSHSNS